MERREKRNKIIKALGEKCIHVNPITGKQCNNKDLHIHCKQFIKAGSKQYEKAHRLNYILKHLNEYELLCAIHHRTLHRTLRLLEPSSTRRVTGDELKEALGNKCIVEGCKNEPIYLHMRHDIKVMRRFRTYYSLRYLDEVELLCEKHAVLLHDREGIEGSKWGLSRIK